MFNTIQIDQFLWPNNKKTINLNRLYIGLNIKPGMWRDISNFSSGGHAAEQQDSQKGFCKLVCEFPRRFLNSGIYNLSTIFGENQRYVLYKADSIITFEVLHKTTGPIQTNFRG